MSDNILKEQRWDFYDICTEKMQMTPEERQLLRKVLQNKNSYLEIGSGYSTIWCSQFVPRIISVEARKTWFDEIKLYLEKFGISNVELHFLPPESCAYYEDGRETWNNRNTPEGSDYGRTEEFIAYLRGIERLLDGSHFDVVLVDGHVRKQVIEMLIRKKYDGIVLLHDVTPERDYVNRPILTLDGVKIDNQADSLAVLSLFNQQCKESRMSHLPDEQLAEDNSLTNSSSLFFDKASVKRETYPKVPAHRLNKVIGFCLSQRDVAPYKLEVGGQRYTPGWITTDKSQLDVTNLNDWKEGFKPGEIKIIFAEHLLEHLCPDEARRFLEIACEYLCDGGRIRLAVPDAMHPSAWYHELCKPGGVDIGSDDHKYFFSYDNINEFFDHDKYDLRLLEWWDEHGFHKAQWQNDDANGKVERSSQFYNGRIAQSKQLQELLYNTTPEKMRPYYSQYGITYTSLIFDLIKKKTKCVKIADHPENSRQLIDSKTSLIPTIKTIDRRVLDLPHLPSEQLVKIVGFCLSRRDVALDFAFGRHFPWLRFEKLNIGPWFVHLWGHGDFTSFIMRQNGQTKIVAGYTQQELELLGTERLENRGVFIRIRRDIIEVENDIVGSFRVFYGGGRDNVCVSSIEGLVLQSIGRQPIDKTNLVQFLLLGHLTGEQTIWPHIFTMRANSLLRCNGTVFETCPLAPLHFRTSENPVDGLYAATVSTIRRYTEGYEKLFLPLSGGYDSRMLAACIQQPERVTARTYDYSYPIETAYEVSRARLVAKAAGIKDWDCCDLGADFVADYGRRWFDIFGTSHHLHGMYILSFYDKTFGVPKSPVPILSGFIGDAFVGHQLNTFEQVRDADFTTRFWRSQFVNVEGFQVEELRSLLNYDVDSLLPAVFRRWNRLWQECEGEEHQKFILNLVQHRGRNHVSYLCTLADIYGAAITPFTDRKYIETVLGLPYKFLFNRLGQEQVFQKYFPSFWLDESKLPEYKHCIEFLCMRKRKLDNIFPIVMDNSVQSHLLFRPEAVKQWVQEFTEKCNSKELIYVNKTIRSLYRLNTLQPLFYFDYLNEPESEHAQDIKKDGGIISDRQFELSCATVKQDGFSSQEFFRKGVKLLQSGSSTEALDYFNQAKNLCSNMPDLHFAIATAYAQLGDLSSARKACQIELSLQPENDGAKRLLRRIEKEMDESILIC